MSVRLASIQGRCGIACGLAALTLAGCATTGQQAPQTSLRGATVAFESIEGAPQAVFTKLVRTLGEEAKSRRVAVVSREATPQYRVRAYMAANIQHGRTTIAWLWDVYDTEQHRMLRITGEEPGTHGAKNGWANADDAVVRRIAQSGMGRLAAFLGRPAPEQPRPEPRQAVAALDDFAPEASGIFRMIRERVMPGEDTPAQAAAPPDPAAVPTPPSRGAAPGRERPADRVTLAKAGD